MKRKTLTLSGLLTRYAGGTLLLLALLLGVVVQQVNSHTLQGALQDKAEALAKQLAVISLDAVLIYDYGTLERYVRDLVSGSDVLYLQVARSDGEVLAEAGESDAVGSKASLRVEQPIYLADNIIGQVSVVYDTSTTEQTVLLLSTLWLVGLVLVTGVLFWVMQHLLRRHLVEPVTTLAASVNPFENSGDDASPTLKGAPREVEQLAHTFGQMRAEIAQHIAEMENANRLARSATQRFCREQRLASIGQMAAGLAHGLNTPLGNIIGYVQQARREGECASAQRLDVIERQAHKCSEIVRNLLAAARSPEVILQRTDVAKLIAITLKLLRPVMRDNGTEIVQHGPKHCQVVCDVSAFEQVLFNLTSNAVQAGANRVDVELSTDKGRVVVDICDNGQGIPPERQAKIFEAFFTTKEAGSGTGLGLYLCQTLMRSMEGDIELHESRPGRTVFRLTLPHTHEPEQIA
ncbi:MAG: sensor histidine kinase [Pseudomonadota bacterium]